MVESVVDYRAWEKGYMPPSEHQLIHALTYEGARVVASSHIVKGNGWWIVLQGEPFGHDEEWELMMFATERQVKYAKDRRAAARAIGEVASIILCNDDPDNASGDGGSGG